MYVLFVVMIPVLIISLMMIVLSAIDSSLSILSLRNNGKLSKQQSQNKLLLWQVLESMYLFVWYEYCYYSHIVVLYLSILIYIVDDNEIMIIYRQIMMLILISIPFICFSLVLRIGCIVYIGLKYHISCISLLILIVILIQLSKTTLSTRNTVESSMNASDNIDITTTINMIVFQPKAEHRSNV